MFSNGEFEEWCDKLGYSRPSIELIRRIRESEPSRAVGGGHYNVVGSYLSKKMGKSIQFESHTIELSSLYLKEHGKSVIELYDQPPKIQLSYHSLNGKVVSPFSTPDYFVIYLDQAGWEEWKEEEELCKLAESAPSRYVKINGSWHCPPGEEYAKQFGRYYWLRYSSEINYILQRNIVFLEDYLLDSENFEAKTESRNTILSVIQNKPGIRLLDLIKMNGLSADDIYALIARGDIFVDLEQDLISEPEYVPVFSDEQTSLAYKAMELKKAPLFNGLSLSITPGSKLIWNEKSWIVTNIEEEKVSLTSNDISVELGKNQFFDLAYKKSITGTDNDIIQEIDHEIDSRLISASEQELQAANYRYNIILPVLEGAEIEDLVDLPVTKRTIRNWVSSYRKAEQLYNAGYIGLIPYTKKRGNRTSHLPESTLKLSLDVINKNKVPTNQSYKALYGKHKMECDAHGIIAPSLKSFINLIKSTLIGHCSHKGQESTMEKLSNFIGSYPKILQDMGIDLSK